MKQIQKIENSNIVPQNNTKIISDYLSGQSKPKDFDECVEIGFAAREMRDLSQWVIGKLALEVTEKYKGSSLTEFCKRIGYGGLERTVEVYRWTAEQYLNKYGKLPFDFDGQLLSYSYYRTVAKTDNPMEWIEKAQDENLTIAQLSRKVKGQKISRECNHENQVLIPICTDCGLKL